MSVTDVKTYYWVGGATGTTAASRFDWNNAANWRTKINDLKPPSDYNLQVPETWPIGGDIVNLGYGGGTDRFHPTTSSPNYIKSPLLFGGFSGSGNTGCWICNGETGAGLSGASGTTFQAQLKSININYYPYHIVGGGVTGNAHRSYLQAPYDLNSMEVNNMNTSVWTALGVTASTRQTSLKVKTQTVNVEKFWFDRTAEGFTSTDIFIDFVDCWDNKTPAGSTGYISTSIQIANNTLSWNNSTEFSNTNKLWLSDCKISAIKKTKSLRGNTLTTSPMSIYGKNIKVGEIEIPQTSTVVFDSDCLIGKLWLTSDGYTGENKIYFDQKPQILLSGTYKYYNALRSLGLPGVTLPQDESEVMYLNSGGYTGMPPLMIFGGISGGQGITFSANEISIFQAIDGQYQYPNVQVSVASRASIGTLHLQNSELVSNMKGANDQSIEINSLLLGSNATANFRYDPSFNNWKFGLALASSSGLTLNGGIQFLSETSSIKGDPGIRFINYGYYAGRDFRNNKPIDLSTTYTPPEAN